MPRRQDKAIQTTLPLIKTPPVREHNLLATRVPNTHTHRTCTSLFSVSVPRALTWALVRTLKWKIPFHNISLLNYIGKISWLTLTTPKCTFSFRQNFSNHWKCYRVMTLLTWNFCVKLPSKWAKTLFVVTLQVRNYCHKYALQADKPWLQ